MNKEIYKITTNLVKNKTYYILFVILVVLLILHLFYKIKSKQNFNIAVIIHGFSPRSFKYTHQSIKENIINTLKQNPNVNVDLYHYSLLSKKSILDSSRKEEIGITINNDDSKLLNCNKLVTEYQEDLKFPRRSLSCTHYHDTMDLNFRRALYGESQCMKHFPIENYDVCIMVASDSLITKQINFKEVLDSYKSNCVYTTAFNKAGGVANGFYIAPPNVLENICNRYYDLQIWCSQNKNKKGDTQNAEKFLKFIIKKHNIINKNSDMFYLKIRATGKSNNYISKIDSQDGVINIEEIKKKYGK